MKRCEVCGKEFEVKGNSGTADEDVKGLLLCDDCRRDRKNSIDKAVDQ